MIKLTIELENHKYDIFSNSTCQCGAKHFKAYSLSNDVGFNTCKHYEFITLECQVCGKYYHIHKNDDGNFQIYYIDLNVINNRLKELEELVERYVNTQLFCCKEAITDKHRLN